MQATNWPVFRNLSEIGNILNRVEIASDNWMQNVLNIYKVQASDSTSVDEAIQNA